MKKSNINSFEKPSEIPFSELVRSLHRYENAREFLGKILGQCGGEAWAVDGLIMLIEAIIQRSSLSEARDFGEDLQTCLFEWTPEHSSYAQNYKKQILFGKPYGAEETE